MWSWYKRYRRRKTLARPFPPAWQTILSGNVAQYSRLPEDGRARLRDTTQILVAEKTWEGCGELNITDEIKVTIAGQASLLLLGLKGHDYFGRALSILVYPSLFVLPGEEWQSERARGEVVAGQAVYRGPVILSWDRVLSEGRDLSGGNNLVVHEFAHQLDFLDGYVNGTPQLLSPVQGRRWHEVMTAEFTRQLEHVRAGRETFLGQYAVRNEGEFFAVASERFFTRPARLRHHHPTLYDVLTEYYGIEPIRWFSGGENSAEPM
jgi:Mlc titration factor MtfA (ptsG expression regulator)